MNKRFELGNKDIKFEQDINKPEITGAPSDIELEPESQKEPMLDEDSEETESEHPPKKESVLEKYSDAKEHKSKIGLWNDMLEKYKKDMEKEKQAYEKAMKEEKKLQGTQN